MQQQITEIDQLGQEYAAWFEEINPSSILKKASVLYIKNLDGPLAAYDVKERKLIYINETADHSLSAGIKEVCLAKHSNC